MLHLIADTLVQVNSIPAVQTPIEWIATHIQLVGWPALVGLAWTAGNYFKGLKHQVKETITQIDHMATNHFPHMQESLAKQDAFLANIDKNIERMANKQ